MVSEWRQCLKRIITNRSADYRLQIEELRVERNYAQNLHGEAEGKIEELNTQAGYLLLYLKNFD
jgi:hypothetical protein